MFYVYKYTALGFLTATGLTVAYLTGVVSGVALIESVLPKGRNKTRTS